jgi:hypothetical protein
MLAAAAQPLVRSPNLDRLRVGIQTKKDTLALQVGGWSLGENLSPTKINLAQKQCNLNPNHIRMSRAAGN